MTPPMHYRCLLILDGSGDFRSPCHCEEQSDVAISWHNDQNGMIFRNIEAGDSHGPAGLGMTVVVENKFKHRYIEIIDTLTAGS